MGYRMVTWPMTSRDPERSISWPRYAERAISWKLLELETSNLVCSFLSGMPSGRTNNFPESGRGLGHVTHTIFGSTVGYPSDSLASCFSTPQAWKHCNQMSKLETAKESLSVTAKPVFSSSYSESSTVGTVCHREMWMQPTWVNTFKGRLESKATGNDVRPSTHPPRASKEKP